MTNRIPILLLLSGSAILVSTARAESPAETFRQLGGQVREEKGIFVELNIDAKSFTPDNYRLLGSCTTLKKLTLNGKTLNGKTLNDETLPLLAGLVQLEEVSTTWRRSRRSSGWSCSKPD